MIDHCDFVQHECLAYERQFDDMHRHGTPVTNLSNAATFHSV